MANKDHLALLKKDVDAWNEWRVKNPRVHPDLREADLVGADLREAYLTEAEYLEKLSAERTSYQAMLQKVRLGMPK